MSKSCFIYDDTLRVVVGGSVRYPDAFVAFGLFPNTARQAENPVVVFEVLSPSTAIMDHIVKALEYRATPSIKRLVLVEQDRIEALVESRENDRWRATLYIDPAAVLEMPEIGISVPLRELYQGVIDA
jgi:Uma2 family endonuclease